MVSSLVCFIVADPSPWNGSAHRQVGSSWLNQISSLPYRNVKSVVPSAIWHPGKVTVTAVLKSLPAQWTWTMEPSVRTFRTTLCDGIFFLHHSLSSALQPILCRSCSPTFAKRSKVLSDCGHSLIFVGIVTRKVKIYCLGLIQCKGWMIKTRKSYSPFLLNILNDCI